MILMAKPKSGKDITERLERRALRAGADGMGVADVAALRDIAPEHDAARFLDGARAVVMAVAADPPAVRGANDPEEYMALAWTGYQRADAAALSMRRFLHDAGYKTEFIVREWHRARDRHGKNIKTLPLKQAAAAAGLGTIGRHTLLITPEHGPRVRLSGFVTDAPLTAGKPMKNDLCDGCNACARACPSGAIAENKPFGFAECSAYLFAGLKLTELRDGLQKADAAALRGNADRLAQSATGWVASLSKGRRLYYNCGACIRVCNPGGKKKKK
jgi:epoxyqueuosine reductase QueG